MPLISSLMPVPHKPNTVHQYQNRIHSKCQIHAPHRRLRLTPHLLNINTFATSAAVAEVCILPSAILVLYPITNTYEFVV